MDSVSVSELKAHLSRYLRRVREGGEIQVVDRGKPIARLVGAGDSAGEGQVERLIADGVLRAGSGRMLEVIESEPVRVDFDLMAAVDHERTDRF